MSYLYDPYRVNLYVKSDNRILYVKSDNRILFVKSDNRILYVNYK